MNQINFYLGFPGEMCCCWVIAVVGVVESKRATGFVTDAEADLSVFIGISLQIVSDSLEVSPFEPFLIFLFCCCWLFDVRLNELENAEDKWAVDSWAILFFKDWSVLGLFAVTGCRESFGGGMAPLCDVEGNGKSFKPMEEPSGGSFSILLAGCGTLFCEITWADCFWTLIAATVLCTGCFWSSFVAEAEETTRGDLGGCWGGDDVTSWGSSLVVGMDV